ncbi:MAG: bifunctional diaminohydroxyphosphoribosylaminopyrimidine deaminase/5-amino-6-(5-phosphoribosylamino)uracil reductase RibD [Bacteroidales bacterium]|nr:bifunctional diaminohydroxyphosphoribosylaminopyrimidine deaminase/5-amino-6-(5-phosphoribosylamino)uracil reductase RibD [Bacteroidales bacterium]
MEQSQHELYMHRCLQLAKQAAGHTAPNPMVGAVIVRNGVVIGEGYHHRCGEPHAEVNAIASVTDHSLLRDATIYVNLEPCAHFGKTPPCCDLIINKGIPHVVVGTLDPHDKVAGKGVERMRAHGINVEVGVCQDECWELNRRFFTFHTKQRPFILLKWAQSADGYIDLLRSDGTNPPVKISTPVTKALNHQIRTQESAILVGTNTAVLDNPHLTVTKWHGPNPVRLVVDRSLRVPQDSRIFDSAAPTVVFTEKDVENIDNITFQHINFKKNIVPQILDFLYRHNILSVIVEGGSQLLQAFIDGNYWDECHIEVAPCILKNGIAAPNFPHFPQRTEHYGPNTMFYYYNR